MKQIEISKSVKSTILSFNEITKILNYVFLKEKVKNYYVSLFFVSDKKMKYFHQKYLNKNSTTDVLTFVLNKKPLSVDFCINVTQAKRQSKIFNVNLKNEIARLIIHCALHSVGYDDNNEINKKEMFKAQEKYLKNIFKN